MQTHLELQCASKINGKEGLAEAVARPQADGDIPSLCLLSVHSWSLSRLELAFRVAGLVYDEAGGDLLQRPKEFI